MTKAKADDAPPVALANTAVEQWPLSRLREAPDNARVHPDQQIADLCASIVAAGFKVPIQVTPDGEIIAGHGRLEAARRLGRATVPVQIVTTLETDADVSAARIQDNRVAERSEWNPQLLLEELKGLRDRGVDLASAGFTDEAVDDMDTDRDDGEGGAQPELEDEPVSRPGDVWVAGRHRLVCGDPSDAGVMDAVVGKASPHLLVTDWGRASGGVDLAEVLGICGADVVYAWTQAMLMPDVLEALEATAYQWRAHLVWDRRRLGGRSKKYRVEHETCTYAVRKGAKSSHWIGGRKQHTLWQTEERSLVPPPELYMRCLRNSSKRKQPFMDPALGSGTTLVAAELCARQCLGIELNPERLDAAVRRWQLLTGNAATLEGGDQTFDQAEAGSRKNKAKNKGRKK